MLERLRRLERVFQNHPIYFVTANAYDRRKILHNGEVHTRLIEFGKEGSAHGAWLGAYVLMPDHLHAFVSLDDRRINLAKWGKSLKNALSEVLRAHDVASPQWQKGFFDHLLRSGESYSEKWHYVRDNPVRAGLVKHWSEWPFLGEIFDLYFHDDAL
jgi:putative transposase